jgi:hypothetical protein
MTHRIVVPFKPIHYEWLCASGPSSDAYTVAQIDAIAPQLMRENSWTGVVDGEPVVCAGTIKQWEGRHLAWAYLAQNTGPHMLWITREVRKALAKVQGRLEFTVRADFPAGMKWAEMLGFEIETPCLEAFGPQGESHVGFVRFN